MTAETFAFKAPSGFSRMIGLLPHSLITEEKIVRVATEPDGTVLLKRNPGVVKGAVVERHKATGRTGVSLLEPRYGLRNGAIATSISHDSHNIVVAGDDEADMAEAVKCVERMQGGIAMVHKGEVLGALPLPVAGLMSDSRKLAALKLEAGSEDPGTGAFTVTSRFNPSEETALAFCVHEIGRVMRLERHTPRESAGRLPTLTADVLRLVVPRGTLLWLGLIEREDGETVLTALKAALTYAAGVTEAERLIAEAAARGREWAINRRAAQAARREGKCPLLRGFAAVYRAEFSQRLYDGHWKLNRSDSPVVWAEDGLALRWPEGFAEIAATADDKWLFRDVPDEPDVAAEILVADGFAIGNDAGNPLWLTGPESLCGEGAWLRLAEGDMLVANARRAADAAGESLPMRMPPLFEKRAAVKGGSPGTVAKPCWSLAVPAALEGSDRVSALARALEALNANDDAVMFTHPEGVFIAESLLPAGWLEDPAEAGRLLSVKAMPYAEGVRHLRASPIRRAAFTGASAPKARRYDPGMRGMTTPSGEAVILTGVVVNRHSVRPVVRFINAEGGAVEETEGRWPKPVDIAAIDRAESTESSGAKVLGALARSASHRADRGND